MNKKLEYYVINMPMNGDRPVSFNIFDNFTVNNRAIEAIKEYRDKGEAGYVKGSTSGFNAFANEIRIIIMAEEWSRNEYEIMVGGTHTDDINKFYKWDCFMQCVPNISMIAREILWQYDHM